jgi:hypothetical protein
MATRMENRNEQLVSGLVWFFKSYFPVISLTILLLLLNLRSHFTEWQKNKTFELKTENFLFSGLFIWGIFGFVVILMQRLSWWEYHYSLLMLPLGILAVKSIERLFEAIRINPQLQRKTLFYIISAVLIMLFFIPTARRLADRIHQFNNIETVKIGTKELKITGAGLEDYKSISADIAFLTKENPKAPIFVVSNPLYYYLSDTPPLFSSNGAMSDMFTAYEWKKLNSEMSAKPPEYIFIESRFIKMIKGSSPTFIYTLNKNYSVYSMGSRGIFYKLNK